MARIHNVTTYRQSPLKDGWELLSAAPGLYQSPEQLENVEQSWLAASVPGTVIETLQKNQLWDLAHPLNVDTLDWWYRNSFEAALPEDGKKIVLRFAGLATATRIWLNGQQILATDNMFRSYEVDITTLLRERNSLYIQFHSLQSLLAKKRPRPHWRTQLVNHQQLRWFRTTFLGRMPGWSPPIQAVGPWRAITLEERAMLSVEQISIQTTVRDDSGHVSAQIQAQSIVKHTPTRVVLVVGDMTAPLHVQQETNGSLVLSGEVSVPNVQRWWPHTHGSQSLYPTKIVIQYPETSVEIDCGKLAFRSIELLDDSGHNFGLRVNGTPIFCRGACWTPLDMVTLTGTYQTYHMSLLAAQRAGLNMLRIGGTMVYEHDTFYDLCDELGILVWQDFMFANLDYPITNDDFLANCRQECEQVLKRLQTHACLAVLCGNSEIEQQVAMLGLPAEMWKNDYFDQLLPEICKQYIDVPYWSSSPGGGTLPFQPNMGNAHYQGVGAFLKPLEDARRSEVRFASECLAFANVPEDQTIDLFMKPGELAVHHPTWKARVPRDAGAAWDFEDIRDYYLNLLFDIDPMKLRYSDMERYLALSRVTTGEVMAYVFAEWRRQGSINNGGLIWFYRDLWPGTGWGILDATGYPKAAYYYLRRVSLPQACFFSDEGLNGLWLHAVNDKEAAIPVEIQLSLYRPSGTLMAAVTKDIALPPRGGLELHVDALFEGFLDLTYAYRFGPPSHNLIVATMINKQSSQLMSEAFYFPHGLPSGRETDLGLRARAIAQPDGTYELTLSTEKFAQSVAIHAENFLPDDNYFHMKPNSERVVTLSPIGKVNTFRGSLSALNTYHEINIRT